MLKYLLIAFLLISACKPFSSSKEVVHKLKANYVGDKSCQSCHNDIYETYHQSGMGRSFSRFDEKTAPEIFNQQEVKTEKSGFSYVAYVENGKMYQKEIKRDDAGKMINELIYEVKYVVGSGNATRSYVMEVNGYLTEMPLTWYVERKMWDMSPGYHEGNLRFDRPINGECMTCHNSFSAHEKGTQNRFKKVALGIGCERCHGPGSEHIEEQLENDELVENPSIVNPKKLNRAEQLSVCQQCHIDGVSVINADENIESFRPGMLLSAHRTIYTTPEHLNHPEEFGIASHGVRLAKSECYTKSQMTCVSCHNPHEPQQGIGNEGYNKSCQNCHQSDEVTCSRPNEPKPMSGDCVSCHLTKSGTSDIPHVTFTDHWIRKVIPKSAKSSTPKTIADAKPDQIQTLVPIPETVLATQSEGESLLAEAIAYFKYYETHQPLKGYLPLVVEKAQKGFAQGADHYQARLALARALSLQELYDEAANAFEEGVKKYPDDSFLWYWKSVNHLKQNKLPQALTAIEESIKLQPNLIEAHQKKAEILVGQQKKDEAIEILQGAIQKNPNGNP